MEDLSRDIMKMADLMQAGDAEMLKAIVMMGRKHSAEVSYSGIDPYIGFIISVLMEMCRKSPREE